MSSSTFALFFLLTLLPSLHTHAREPQFFNKVTKNNNNNVVPNKEQPLTNVPQEQEPNFLPQKENAYGLYGKESDKLQPASTTTTTGEPLTTATTTTGAGIPYKKYLPKNYNPVAYVTEPEDVTDSNSFTEKSYNNNNNNNNDVAQNYYNNKDVSQNYYNNNQQEEESEYRRYPTYAGGSSFNSDPQGLRNARFSGGSSFNSNPQGLRNARFSGGSSFNSDPQGLRNARYSGSGGRYSGNGGETNSYRPQGMSDTRYMENGKYFYDLNAGKYSDNHPYASLRGNQYNNRNYYGNSENFNGEKSIGGYENQDEFQDEEGYNMP